MICAYLVSVLSLLEHSRIPQDEESWFMCNVSIHGKSVCKSAGLGAYVSYSESDPPEPSVIYPLSQSVFNFSASAVQSTFGVYSSSQSKISGKFSGIFVPTESGNYTFSVFMQQYSGSYEVLMTDAPSKIEMELGDDDAAYSLKCSPTSWGSGCFTGSKNAGCIWCNKTFSLTSGSKYPFFAGMKYNYGITFSKGVYLKLMMTTPAGVTRYVTDSDAVVSLSAYEEDETASPSSSPSISASESSSSPDDGSSSGSIVSSDIIVGDDSEIVSGSNKVNVAAIGGGCAGVLLVLIVVAVAVFLITRRSRNASRGKSGSRSAGGKASRKAESSNLSSGGGDKSSRKRSSSGGSRKRSSGGSSKRSGEGSSSGGHHKSGKGSRKRSSSGGHRRSGKGSRKRSSSGGHRKSGEGSSV